MSTPKSSRGFTILELMIAFTVLGIVGVGLMSFYIYSLKANNLNQAEVQMTDSLRKFGSEILIDAGDASSFAVYSQFEPGRTPVASGNAGRYIVFYYTDLTGGIYRTVGYYLSNDAAAGSPQPVLRYMTVFPTQYPNTNSVPLPTTTQSDHQVVLPSVVGTQPQGALFLNKDSTKILMRGQYIVDNPMQSKSGVKQVSRNFSFILVPWSLN